MSSEMESRQTLRELIKLTTELTKEVKSLKQGQTQVWRQKTLEDECNLIGHLYSQSSNYTNLIMVAGYAGILTLWSQLKDEISSIIFLVAGLLILISLFLFVSWEIIKMVQTERQISKATKAAKELEEKGIGGDINDIRKCLRSNISGIGLWPYFFYGSLITGLGSGVVLIGCLLEQIII